MALDKVSLEKHTSKQFDRDLDAVREQLLAMGRLVQHQIREALRALVEGDGELGQKVARDDFRVNRMEVEIDEACTRILARHQPQASDLRLITAIIKTITDLERIGDEAEKIGRLAADLAGRENAPRDFSRITQMERYVSDMLADSLESFATFDADLALAVSRQDDLVDREYVATVRQCVTYMMENQQAIQQALDIIWAARSLERIGDHATNIGEYVIYFVQGRDVRHTTLEAIEKDLEASRGQRRRPL